VTFQIDFADISVHKHMLTDRIRCEAFRRALHKLVSPDSVVLDVGAGTGLLSMFAARAGARTVYAVERTRMAELARNIIAENGLADRIQVYQQDMADVTLPEPVDIIVSEFLGGCGLDESVLPVLAQARDRWLKPSGKMVPHRVSSWLAPAYDNVLDADVYFWKNRPYGIDLGQLSDETLKQIQPCRYNVDRHNLLSSPQKMWEVDLSTVKHDATLQQFEARLSFEFQRSGQCNALAAWFEADLCDGVVLSNKPAWTYTHWGRWVFPMGASKHVEKGTRIDARVTMQLEQIGRSKSCWDVQLGDYTFSSEDVTTLVS
jgi:SAM-dependent methyltransferase